MNRQAFRTYRQQFDTTFHSLLAESQPGELDEQALPSYTHANFLMAWLFWERIRLVIGDLERMPPGQVLDFGCGAGVLFPALSAQGSQIYACDLDLRAAKRLASEQGWSGIHWLKGDASLPVLEDSTFDTIICLDVLEHVDPLDGLAGQFRRLLRPQGRLIVSGPTESPIYQLGRRLAGFSGDYHVRSVYDVEKDLAGQFHRQSVRRLIWPITLFRISTWTPIPPSAQGGSKG